MKHAELIERLREATQGNEELDHEVMWRLTRVGLPNYRERRGVRERNIAHEWGEEDWRPLPYYEFGTKDGPTRSLDAAVGLCERVLPGWHWSLHQSQIAQVCPCDEYGSIIERLELEEFGRTPALALCIAILSALSVDIGDDAQANECLTKES